MKDSRLCALEGCDKPIERGRAVVLAGQRVLMFCCREHEEDFLRREWRKESRDEGSDLRA